MLGTKLGRLVRRAADACSVASHARSDGVDRGQKRVPALEVDELLVVQRARPAEGKSIAVTVAPVVGSAEAPPTALSA